MHASGGEEGGLKSGLLDLMRELWSVLLGVVGKRRAGVCTPGSEEIRLSLSMTPGWEGGLTSGPLDLREERWTLDSSV